MTTKTYSNRGNCIRAARTALGKTAKLGEDFKVEGSGKVFTWAALKAAKAKRAKREAGTRSPVSNQPQAQKLLKYIDGKAEGHTVEECMGHLGVSASHTVRGLISRLNSEGAGIKTTRKGRIGIYSRAA